METKTHLWHAPLCLLKIVCPFQTYDCGFRLNFKQYIPKQCIHFGINIYKLCSISKCMNGMDIYLGNSRVGVTENGTVSHANVRHRHKQYKDKFIHCLTYCRICQRGKSTAGGQYDLTERKWHRTYCHRTTYWKETTFCLGLKVTCQQRSKVIKWIHTEKYAPPTTYDNFYDKHGNASKPKIIQNHTNLQVMLT